MYRTLCRNAREILTIPFAIYPLIIRTDGWLSPAVLLSGLVFVMTVSADSNMQPVQIVSPGQSIQAAIDRTTAGGIVLIRPGTYRETADPVNGLVITRSVHLIGLSTSDRKVVLTNSGTQRNGIVAVPRAHTDCMSCHSTLAPPFSLLPGVSRVASQSPMIQGLSITGITIQDFSNNGLFTRNVKDFQIVDVHSVGNKNYGIFPTLSENGVISRSTASGAGDSGIWIETSTNVTASWNVVEANVVGIEVSNSEDVVLAHNDVHGNSVGIAMLFLPHMFSQRPDIRRITIHDNRVYDNNRMNTVPPGSLLSGLPSGVGMFHLGADDSVFTGNVIENHKFAGIAILDFCLAMAGGPLDCKTNATLPPAFILDSAASNNRVLRNQLRNNGTNPDPASPFAFAASDLALLTNGDHANCFTANTFTRFFSTLGFLPECR